MMSSQVVYLVKHLLNLIIGDLAKNITISNIFLSSIRKLFCVNS